MEQVNARELLRVVSRIRSVAGDMTLQRLSILLAITLAGEEGITMTNLTKQLGIQQSNTSKLVHSFTKLTSRKEPGPGLVSAESDPMDLSTKVCRLTLKGQQAVKTILGDVHHA